MDSRHLQIQVPEAAPHAPRRAGEGLFGRGFRPVLGWWLVPALLLELALMWLFLHHLHAFLH